MSTLGSLNVALTAQTDAFTKGMEKAQHDLGHFAEHAEHLNERLHEHSEGFARHAEGLGNIFSGAGIESGISGITESLSQMAGNAASSLASLGPIGIGIGAVAIAATGAAAAIVGFGMALKSVVEPQMEMIDKTFKMGEALGVVPDWLMTFHAVAQREGGLAADSVDASIQKMMAAIGQATSGGDEKAVFARLGLDAQQLAAQAPDQVFLKIAAAIGEVQSHYEKVRDIKDIFGKSGGSLLSTMTVLSEGADELHEKLLANGVALSAMDSGRVVAAKEVWEDFGQQLEGIKNRITVEMAPAILMLGEAFIGVLPDAKTFGEGVLTAVDDIGYGIATLMDLTDGLLSMFWNLTKTVTGLGAVASVFREIGEAVLDMTNNAPGGSNRMKWLDAMEAAKKKLTEEAEKMTSTGFDFGQEFDDGMAEGLAESSFKVLETLDKLKDEMDFQKWLSFDGSKLADMGIGMETLKKIFEAKTGDDMQSKMVALAEEAKKFEEFNKATEAVRKLREEIDALQRGVSPEAAKYGKDYEAQIGPLIRQRDALKEAAKAAEELNKLREEQQRISSGMGDAYAKIKQAGGTDAQAAEAQGLQENIDLWKEKARMIEEAKTPLDKYHDQLSKLQDMYVNFVLDDDEFAKGVGKAQDDLRKATHKDQHDSKVGAEEVSRSFVVTGSLSSANDPLLDTAKQQLAEQKKQTKPLQDMASQLAKGAFSLLSL